MPLRKEPAAGDSSEERFFLASLCITSCFNHEHETFSEKVAVPGTSCRKASYTDKKKDSRPIALFFFNFIYSKISKISLMHFYMLIFLLSFSENMPNFNIVKLESFSL